MGNPGSATAYPMVQKSDHNCTLFHNLCKKLSLNSYFMLSVGASLTINRIYVHFYLFPDRRPFEISTSEM